MAKQMEAQMNNIRGVPQMMFRFGEPRQQSDKKTVVDLYLYDNVTAQDRFDWNTWSYVESKTSADYFRNQLANIPDTAQINLYINSNGGSAAEGTCIYNQLKRHPAHIVGHVDGVCYSVAFLILQACDERVMGLGSSALAHNMWEVVAGNAEDLRKAADDLDALMESNRQLFLAASGGKISEEELKSIMDDEKILTPDDCIKYGFADKIVTDDENPGSDSDNDDENGAAEPGSESQIGQIDIAQQARLNVMQSFIEKHNAMQSAIKQIRRDTDMPDIRQQTDSNVNKGTGRNEALNAFLNSFKL